MADDDIGFRVVQQSDDSIGVEVWQASDLTSGVGLFSDQTGTALDWTYVEQWPQATRAIAGGDETGNARLLRQVTDASVETAWERIVETFVDARAVDEDDPTANDELDEAAQKRINDGAPSQSFRLTIANPTGLFYGTDIRVGDLVRAYPAGVQVDERITEATVTVRRGEGETVEMWVGKKSDDPEERLERHAVDFQRRLTAIERVY